MGFYAMISAALQRRVYLGSDERPLFGNQFIILVGPPATGKGLTLIPIDEILRYHKLKRFKIPTKEEVANTPTQGQTEAAMAMLAEFETANNKPLNGAFSKLSRTEEPLRIPIAAQATTYEALVRAHSQAIRSMIPSDKTSRLIKSGMYTHSSICFCLEEISSLFKKHQESVVQYLITAFDCQTYKNDTKTQGTDYVVNSCLNFLGGTTPAFMKETFDTKLLNDGFSSRTIFVYEEEPRGYCFDLAIYSKEQLDAKKQIIDHVDKLTEIFGLVTYAPDARDFIKHYVEELIGRQKLRTNSSPKLEAYYGRKRVHVQKLAMAIHFAESTTMVIELADCKRAIELLDMLEQKMDKALNVGGRNPLGRVAERVYKFLERVGPRDTAEIWAEFVDEVNAQENLEVLDFLLKAGRVRKLKNEKYIAV